MSAALPQRHRVDAGEVLGLAGPEMTVLSGAAGTSHRIAATGPASSGSATAADAPAALRSDALDGWADLFSTVAAVRDRRRA